MNKKPSSKSDASNLLLDYWEKNLTLLLSRARAWARARVVTVSKFRGEFQPRWEQVIETWGRRVDWSSRLVDKSKNGIHFREGDRGERGDLSLQRSASFRGRWLLTIVKRPGDLKTCFDCWKGLSFSHALFFRTKIQDILQNISQCLAYMRMYSRV